MDIEALQAKLRFDGIDGTCEVHGETKGVRFSEDSEYRCVKCLEEELDKKSKALIESGQALEIPLDD